MGQESEGQRQKHALLLAVSRGGPGGGTVGCTGPSGDSSLLGQSTSAPSLPHTLALQLKMLQPNSQHGIYRGYSPEGLLLPVNWFWNEDKTALELGAGPSWRKRGLA